MTPPALLRRLLRSDRGASLVEFAVILPMLIVLFAIVFEGGRMTWSYQSAANGVRDAARYVGRIAPANVCTLGTLSTYTTGLLAIVRDSASGTSLFPNARLVTVDSVAATCVEGADWPGVDPVVQVTATITIALPFGHMFQAVGGNAMGPITATITDRTRVFGT